MEDLDHVFFSSSMNQVWSSESERSAFRERWVGSYLTYDKDETFLAKTTDGRVVGYLVGSLRDPAVDPIRADLAYFQAFAPLTKVYPAHFHINVASQHRSAGLGARLVEAFAAHARLMGSPGVHIVTGKGMRNVSFYERSGFATLAEAPWKSGAVVMLGRRLSEDDVQP